MKLDRMQTFSMRLVWLVLLVQVVLCTSAQSMNNTNNSDGRRRGSRNVQPHIVDRLVDLGEHLRELLARAIDFEQRINWLSAEAHSQLRLHGYDPHVQFYLHRRRAALHDDLNVLLFDIEQARQALLRLQGHISEGESSTTGHG